MTPDQMQRAERYASLMAVTSALRREDRVAFMNAVDKCWPRLRGAQVADILDMTTDRDMFLGQTEPFFEKFADQLPGGVSYAASFAAHVVIILGRPLTPGRVIVLLQRAGTVAPPRYPDVKVSVWTKTLGPYTDANYVMLQARAEQGMRAAGVPEDLLTEFRSSVRRTGVPGFSRNAADVAAWVTLTDEPIDMPRARYNPTDDLAVLVMFAELNNLVLKPSPAESQVAQALANLRTHLDLSSVETVAYQLEAYFGKGH